MVVITIVLLIRSGFDEDTASGPRDAQTTTLATSPTTTQTTTQATTTTIAAPTAAPPVVMVAVGDIACDPDDGRFEDGKGTDDNCRQMHTSDVALTMNPDFVAVLGDLQYSDGDLADFYRSYDPSWGRLLDVTYPTPGNHDYYSDEGAGYFTYFGERAGIPGEGYYSYDAGPWHVVVLNTLCDEAGGCEADSPQGIWLAADLADNDAACTLAYGHYPRFSSGDHGDGEGVAELYQILYDDGVDIYLAGHDHNYERLAQLDPEGSIDPSGIRNFVVGTGGRDTRVGTVKPRPITESWSDDTFGVLVLELSDGSYTFEFVSDGSGSFTDVGSSDCH